ncbi:MAG: hypothetical protein JWM57_2840 [Phycisphaerales bacterium]|nr:hypothetical protein [Phycisphaerales bacterium]
MGRRSSSFLETLETRRLIAFADVEASWGTNGVGVAAQAFSEQDNGRILAADGSGKSGNLVRLNADGSYDTTFSHDGKVPYTADIVAARQVTGGNIVIAFTYSRRSPGQSEGVYTR